MTRREKGWYNMAETRKPKTPADYAIWRARLYLDWIQSAFDGTGDYDVDHLAERMADEMRILTAEARAMAARKGVDSGAGGV